MKPDITKIQSLNPEAVFTPAEAATLLGMSRQGVQHLINKKQLKSIRVASRYFILGGEIINQIN